jgi:hypothetical protein
MSCELYWSFDKVAVTIANTEEADGDILKSILSHSREGGNLQQYLKKSLKYLIYNI